jgi:uncharacterized protein YqeY
MFTSINDLRVQMMKMKTVDKEKAQILTLLLDATQKVAKEQRREAVTEDITVAVKKMMKMAEQAIALNVEGAQAEFDYLSQFAPKVLSEDETKVIATNLKEKHSGNMGAMMKEAKETYGDTLDMKILSSLLR